MFGAKRTAARGSENKLRMSAGCFRLLSCRGCTFGKPALNTRLQSQKVTVATQTGHESPDLAFNPDKMTTDKHCYECKVRYRDPKPQDLVMYLHAWKYKGPGWEYETELPEWARVDWHDADFE